MTKAQLRKCPCCNGTKKVKQFVSLMGGELWQEVECANCYGKGYVFRYVNEAGESVCPKVSD